MTDRRQFDLRSLSAVLAVFTFLLTASPSRLQAQASDTAGKSANIFVFGGYEFVQPDYGPDYLKDNGFVYGADYVRYFRFRYHPIGVGIEARGTHVTGQLVDEGTFTGGIRIDTVFFTRYHPFIDGEIGRSSLKYHFLPFPGNPSYTSDTGVVYAYGFGVDVDLWRNFGLKLDGQQENWTMSSNSTFTLGPAAYSAAITYRIPFKSYIGRRGKWRSEAYDGPPAPTAPPVDPNAAAVTTTTSTDSTTTTTTTPAPDNTMPPANPAPDNSTPPPPPPPPPASTTDAPPPPQVLL